MTFRLRFNDPILMIDVDPYHKVKPHNLLVFRMSKILQIAKFAIIILSFYIINLNDILPKNSLGSKNVGIRMEHKLAVNMKKTKIS